MSTETSFGSGITATSSKSISYGTYSSTRSYEITQGDTKINISSILNPDGLSSDYYGNIVFSYVLTNDRNGLSSIKPMYSTTGASGTFSEMTEYTGGTSEGKNDLASSTAGTTHTFIWNSPVDAGYDYKNQVWVKFIAYDRPDLIGDTMFDVGRNFLLDNAPEAPTIVSPTEAWFEKIRETQIIGTIPNPRSGYTDLHIKIEIASDSGFNTLLATFESAVVQTGWEYYNDSAWVDVPITGIPVSSDNTLVGNQWRFMIQTEDGLEEGFKYIRAVAGGVL